jgi:hypothetical protein
MHFLSPPGPRLKADYDMKVSRLFNWFVESESSKTRDSIPSLFLLKRSIFMGIFFLIDPTEVVLEESMASFRLRGS